MKTRAEHANNMGMNNELQHEPPPSGGGLSPTLHSDAPVRAAETVRSEIQEYLRIRKQRRWVFPRAALVGALAGLVALCFRIGLTNAEDFRTRLTEWAQQAPLWGWMLPLLFTLSSAVISVFLVRRFAPETAGSGIPHLESVLRRFRRLEWKRVLLVKFFGGLAALGGGLALGREGPTVQMGGAVGDAISRLLRVSGRERLALVSAGAGAGLAAAFNAPLSGLVFVLEEVRRDFQPVVFGAAFVAAAVASIVVRVGSGQVPIFHMPNYPVPPLGALPLFAVLGLVTGLLGVLFNKSLYVSLNLYARIPARFVLPAVALTGGAVGLVGWFSPDMIGGGHELAESALRGDMLLYAIPLCFGVRFLLTITNYGCGAPGGVFAPLLVLGAFVGLGIGEVAHGISPSLVPIPAVFAVVGMAAYFTAIIRAPLTGIMLIVEMTGNYNQMLPLLVACFCAYAVAEMLKDMPLYEGLMERDLRRSGDMDLLKDPAVVDFIVQEGAPFAGKPVRSLGLPSGCILVRCSDGQHEWVPKADTRLESHMRITAMMSPEASGGLAILRHGCAPSSE
ncbi:MAG: H(+)/Cl(-) exchange transporter ClcA [Kiritimatiellae bacterium]|nr:H(+)/Cl(-) exchange transporter ClcA [Kiritimatiellia bacterium]